MRVITQHVTGGPEVLEVAEVATPVPGPGEVRVNVTAAGVNPVDAAVRAGAFPLLGEPPFTVGWDVAGVVDALGDGVEGLRVGDRVFGMPRFPSEAAAYAEQVLAPAADLARTPAALSDAHAAGLPLVGLTAWQALVEVAEVGPGTRVLVQAGGGGVGHVAVQLAAARGAEVVATASPRKVGFVRALGADEVVDYTSTDLATIEPADVVIDPFGGDQGLQSLALTRDHGVLVVLVGDATEALRAEAEQRGVRVARISVKPDPEALAGLVDLVQQGRLLPHVQATYPLESVAEAHAALADGVQGKLVLMP